MADWERRLVEGDLPEDFLEVTLKILINNCNTIISHEKISVQAKF